MFADDLTTYCATQTVDQLTQKIQAISNRLQAWAKFNSMVIHPGKTKIIILSHTISLFGEIANQTGWKH